MPQPNESRHGLAWARRRARDTARAGFTLIELVLVLLLAVILSGLAVPSLSGLGTAKAHMTAAQVRSLLVFSQQWAIGTGRPTWVGYDTKTKRMSAFQARADNTDFSVRVALQDPLTKGPLTADLSDLFVKVDHIEERYGGDVVMKFDPTGTLVDSNDVPLNSDVVVPLAERIGVRIRQGTGFISAF